MRAARASSLRALALLAALAGGPALADEPKDPWEQGEPRPFLSMEVDLGTSERLALAAGWGKPHSRWGGLMAEGFLTNAVASLRLGGRVDLQAVALEAGLRLNSTFGTLPLPDVDRQESIPEGTGYDSRVLDLSASGGLPLGPGFAIWGVVGVRQLSSLGDVQVQDPVYTIVYRPPWLAAASAGWLASLRGGALLLGGRAQWAFETGRGGAPFVRLGPVVYWRLEPHLALAGELIFPVSSPDHLGLVDQTSAYLVLAFTAATGDRPRLP